MIWAILIAIIIVVAIFIKATSSNKEISPELREIYDELNAISEETGLTDFEELRKIKFQRDNHSKHVNDIKQLDENRIRIDAENAECDDSIEFYVAGIYYRSDAAKDEAKYMSCGELVSLRKDINNEHDSYAIKVIYNRKHIGFVPSSDNVLVGDLMNNYKYKAVVLHSFQRYNTVFYDYDIDLIIKVYFFQK